jgi:putative peptidoglycan lipid II flippase
MKKAAFAIMIITVLSKVVGFGREIALSYVYGASTITDAYLVSLTIPGVVFSFIGAGIGTGFVPMFSRIKHEHGAATANRFTSNLTSLVIVFCAIVTALGVIFAKPLVSIFASGFSGEALQIAVRFTRISLFAIYFTGLIGIYSGYLRLHESYLVPNLIGFPMNFIIIISIVMSSRTSFYVLVVGTLLARAAEFAFLIPYVRRKGYCFEPVLDIRDNNIQAMVYLALPVIIGTSVDQINVLVDRTLASGIAMGGISALNYASKLTGFVQGLFVTSISSVMYPIISNMASERNLHGLKSTLSEAIGLINITVVPITVGAIIFSDPIVDFLFGRGAFTPEAAVMTSTALRFYSIGMLAFGLRDIISRAFYALQDTKTPTVNGVISIGINVVLNVTFSRYFGIGGLALATSIAGILAAFLLILTLRIKIGAFGLREIVRSFGKIIIASVVMGISAACVYGYLITSWSSNLSLILAIGIGALSYFILVFFFRVPEVERALAVLKRRFQVNRLSGKEAD